MSTIASEATGRRLTADPTVVTDRDHPVLRGWKRLDDYVDPKLVGTDPTGRSWVIEKVEAADGPAWLTWTLEDFTGGSYGAAPVFCSTRGDAIDFASNAAAVAHDSEA